MFSNFQPKFLTSFLFAILAGGSIASAQNVAGTPEYLLKFNFATDVKACVQIGESDALMVNETGIWGQEFGCSFVAFHQDSRDEFLHVATANCSDDTGVNRPDLISFLYDDDQQIIQIQSQNEFVIEEAVRMSGFINGSTAEISEPLDSYVSRDYKICETN